MPYQRETAGKGGHSDFVRNPDVQSFLSECDYLREPSDAEGRAMAESFNEAPKEQVPRLPEYVVASDASKSDTPISDKLPSTQIGFIKVSHVLIEMSRYAELIDPQTRFVDPFKAADLHRNAAPITFTLPGSNIRYRNARSVRDGFRHAVFAQLSTDRSGGGSSKVIVTDVLSHLCDDRVVISKCPSCQSSAEFVFTRGNTQAKCAECDQPVYMTDWLRLHEDISDFGNNATAMSRMMNAVEHLLLAAEPALAI